MRITIYLIFILLLVSIISLSCGEAIKERRVFKDCKFGLEDVDVKQVGLDTIKVNLEVVVANPNETKAVLDRLEFEVFGNDEHIADGVHEEKTEVPPYEKAFLHLSVTTKNKSVGKVLLSALLMESLTIKLSGTAHMDTWIGTIDYPLELEREVH